MLWKKKFFGSSTNKQKQVWCVKEFTKCNGKHSRLRMTSHMFLPGFHRIQFLHRLYSESNVDHLSLVQQMATSVAKPSETYSCKQLHAPPQFLRLPLSLIFCFFGALGPSTLSSITESRSVDVEVDYPVLIPFRSIAHVNYVRTYVLYCMVGA